MHDEKKDAQKIEIKRNSKGHFQRGASGNPLGLRGVISEEKKKVRDILNSALPEIVERVIHQARHQGCVISQKMILDRCLPVKKSNFLQLDPSIKVDYTKPNDVLEVSAWISSALADGTMEKEQADALRASLDQNLLLIEQVQLPNRIDSLEIDGDNASN